MVSIKLKIFFIISKKLKTKKKNPGHPVNRELARSEPKKPRFKWARKIKALTLKFFQLNRLTLRVATHLTALCMLDKFLKITGSKNLERNIFFMKVK